MRRGAIVIVVAFAMLIGCRREQPMSVERVQRSTGAAAVPSSRSIHIALPVVDAAHYGAPLRLNSPEKGARWLQKIAQLRGFETTESDLFIGSGATVKNVTDAIRAAAKDVPPGGTFLLTYCGHGGQIPDKSKDETTITSSDLGAANDALDETWCLYDRMWIDDEVYFALSKFQPGVHVVVIFDGCHAGSPIFRFASRTPRWAARARDEKGEPMRVSMERAATIYDRHPLQYQAWEAAVPSRSSTTVQANVIAITACTDKQQTYDGASASRLSRFVSLLSDAWNAKAFDGNVGALHHFLTSHAANDSTPQLVRLGTLDSTYESTKPFLKPAR